MAMKVVVACLTLLSAPIAANCFEDGLVMLQTNAVIKDHTQPARAASANQEAAGLWNSEQGIVRLLDFSAATVTVNNLGGQGPNKNLANGAPAPEEIRYTNLVRGQDIDLVVTIASESAFSGANDASSDAPYRAHNAERNGIIGANGQINAVSGSTVPLLFKFVDAGTYTPRTMPKFYFTFSDLDERHGGAEKEKLRVDAFDEYYTNDDLKLVGNNTGPNGNTQSFLSSDYANYADNDFQVESPTPTTLSHAVTFLFTQKSEFLAQFSIEQHRDFNSGRNIVFSGISQLVFCQDPSTYLDFQNAVVTTNNLGGMGPGAGAEEIRYSHIGTFGGNDLDFVITADAGYGYNVSNSSQNGLHGDFGHVNLWCGPSKTASEAYLTFTIVQSGTDVPVTLNAFAFVVFDFDQGLHEQQSEYVEFTPNQPGFEGGDGYSSYITTDTTELAMADGQNGAMKFSATKHGTEADNPTSSQMLSRETADKSVVLTFKNTAKFKATFGITPTGFDSGRNFMFSGQDMYSMCD